MATNFSFFEKDGRKWLQLAKICTAYYKELYRDRGYALRVARPAFFLQELQVYKLRENDGFDFFSPRVHQNVADYFGSWIT